MSDTNPLTMMEARPAGSVRLALFSKLEQSPRRSHPAGRTITAFLLIILPTLALLVWLGYRVLARPDWMATLPTLLHEILLLFEFGAAATLILVWAGVGWRAWKGDWPGASRRPAPADIADLYALSPKAFEQYTAGLFRQKGYQVVVSGRSGDHGVDLAVTGRNGKRAVVQCKRYQNTIGEDTVRELYGTMIHEKAAHGFLITTAGISAAARSWARGKPLTLIDGETLVQIAAVIFGRD